MSKKRSKSSFRGKVSKDSEKQNSRGADYGYLRLPKGISVYNPTPGKSEIFDIIPYPISDPKHPDIDEEVGIEVGELWYKRPFKIHRNVGGDSVVCLQSFGERCFMCDYKKKRTKEGAPKDELDEYKSSDRNLYIIKPRGIKDLDDDELYIFDYSQFLFQKALNEELKENDQYEIFPDIEEGYSIKTRWTKESFAGNEFAKAGRIDFKSRPEEIDEDILNKVPDLDSILIRLSYEEMQAKFLEMEDETNDDEESKKSSKKSSKSSKKNQPELTWEDLSDMDALELMDVIKAKDLDIDDDDYDNAEELAKAIAEELDIEIDDEKPTKKGIKQTATHKKHKKDEDDDEDDEKQKKRAEKRSKKSSKHECPYGHDFGDDWEETDDCEDCKLNDACFEKSENKDDDDIPF